MVFTDSNITLVQPPFDITLGQKGNSSTLDWSHVGALGFAVCVRGNASVMFRRSEVSLNTVSAFLVRDVGRLHLVNSVVLYIIGTWFLAGVFAVGKAMVLIDEGSVVESNMRDFSFVNPIQQAVQAMRPVEDRDFEYHGVITVSSLNQTAAGRYMPSNVVVWLRYWFAVADVEVELSLRRLQSVQHGKEEEEELFVFTNWDV